MPSNVVKTEEDEEKWEKAKEKAEEQGHGEDYGYIMSIYKNMCPTGVDSEKLPDHCSSDKESVVHEYMDYDFQHKLQQFAEFAHEKGISKKEFLNEAERAYKSVSWKDSSNSKGSKMSKQLFNNLVKLGNNNPDLRDNIKPVLHHLKKHISNTANTSYLQELNEKQEASKNVKEAEVGKRDSLLRLLGEYRSRTIITVLEELRDKYRVNDVEYRRDEGPPVGFKAQLKVTREPVSVRIEVLCDTKEKTYKAMISGYVGQDRIDEEISMAKGPEILSRIILTAINRRL